MKCWYLFAKLYEVLSQKRVILTLTRRRQNLKSNTAAIRTVEDAWNSRIINRYASDTDLSSTRFSILLRNTKNAITFSEYMADFIYLGTTVTHQDCIHEENKCRIQSSGMWRRIGLV
jgi:hypothetical protein